MAFTTTALAVALGASAAFSGAPPASGTVILDSSGTLWRSMIGWKTPTVLTADNQVRPLKNQQYFWMPAEDPAGKTPTEWRSKHPAEGWALPEFDDSAWDQSSGPQGPGFQPKSMMWWAGCPAQVNVVCSRAKFKVGAWRENEDALFALCAEAAKAADGK